MNKTKDKQADKTDGIRNRMLHVTLTRTCNYNCSWCNQRYDLDKPMYTMNEAKRMVVHNKLRSGKDWINGLNNFPYKSQFQRIVFSGGEPSLHPDFFDIVSKVKGYGKVLLATNLSFDVNKLIKACQENNYRVSVQPSFQFEFADFDVFLEKMKLLEQHGLLGQSIPVSIVELPDREEPYKFKQKFKQLGYKPLMSEFEGYYKGEFRYSDKKGFGSLGKTYHVICSSSITCVRPTGDIVFCATDEYSTEEVVKYGNICDGRYEPLEFKRHCFNYGKCHISSASWIKVESPDTNKVIWEGRTLSGGIRKIVSYSKKNINRLANKIKRKMHGMFT